MDTDDLQAGKEQGEVHVGQPIVMVKRKPSHLSPHHLAHGSLSTSESPFVGQSKL